MKTSILSLLPLLALAACATPKPSAPPPPPAVTEHQEVRIDPKLLQQCPKLKPWPTDHELTKSEVLNQVSIFVDAYSTCWHLHDDLANIVASGFNIQRPAAPVGAASQPQTTQTTGSK